MGSSPHCRCWLWILKGLHSIPKYTLCPGICIATQKTHSYKSSEIMLPPLAQCTPQPPTGFLACYRCWGQFWGLEGTRASSTTALEQENGCSCPEKVVEHANNLLSSTFGPILPPLHPIPHFCQSKLTSPSHHVTAQEEGPGI